MNAPVSDEKRAEVLAAMNRMRSYFPYRIVWAVVNPDGTVEAFANATCRQRNDAVRAGKTVFTFEVPA